MGWEGVDRPFVRGTNPHKGPIDDKTSISSPARWPFVHGLQRGGRFGFKGDARAARLASDSGRFKGRFKRSCGWPVSLVSSSTKWTMSLCRIGGDRGGTKVSTFITNDDCCNSREFCMIIILYLAFDRSSKLQETSVLKNSLK